MPVSGNINNTQKYGWDYSTNKPSSTIGPQWNIQKVEKKALIEAREHTYLMNMADTRYMPKNMGKKILVPKYIPLLDDRNQTDQGIDALGHAYDNGNLYGSSRDIGTIQSKLPVLSENGGRVNRVGFTRTTLEGSFATFGFFTEFTKEDLDHDSDEELMMHIHREMLNGAFSIYEKQLMMDLFSAAGIVRYGGTATNDSEITGESGSVISLPTYSGLIAIENQLDMANADTDTKIITGTRLTDTKTVNEARYVFVGTKHREVLMKMQDFFGQQAFTPVRMYAAGGTVANGEFGAIESFRFIRHKGWIADEGKGADVNNNAGYAETNGKYDIHYMLFVTNGSFTTIGFQIGNDVKFKLQTKLPGDISQANPYGFVGLSSIYWHYGFLAIRPERIAIYKTVVPA